MRFNTQEKKSHAIEVTTENYPHIPYIIIKMAFSHDTLSFNFRESDPSMAIYQGVSEFSPTLVDTRTTPVITWTRRQMSKRLKFSGAGKVRC